MESTNGRVVPFVGVIGIDKEGNIGIETNAEHMPWACVKNRILKCGSDPRNDYNE